MRVPVLPVCGSVRIYILKRFEIRKRVVPSRRNFQEVLKKVKDTVVLFAITLSCFQVAGQTPGSSRQGKEVARLIRDFTSADWQKVHHAKGALESFQVDALPSLIALLDRDERVELTNTADLIYPGAQQFYGHGGILDYDVVGFLYVPAGRLSRWRFKTLVSAKEQLITLICLNQSFKERRVPLCHLLALPKLSVNAVA